MGPENNRAVWYLPKKLLTEHSSFFAAALDGAFSEAESNSIALHDDDPEVFKFFVQWLYCGHDAGIVKLQPVRDVESWIFGDKIRCPGFLNFAMSRLLQYHKDYWMNPNTLRLIYEKSIVGSKLRKFVLEQIRFNCLDEEWPRKGNEDWLSLIMEIPDFGPDFTRLYFTNPADRHLDPADFTASYMVGSYDKKTIFEQKA